MSREHRLRVVFTNEVEGAEQHPQEAATWLLLEIATALVAALAFSWLLREERVGSPREHVFGFVAQVCMTAPLVIYSDIRRRRAKRAVS